MGRQRTFDLEEALQAATRLFWGNYETTSITDLTEAMGIAPNSLYHAFGSKEELFRQVTGRYVRDRDAAFELAFQAPTSVAGVKALLKGYVDVVTGPGHPPGCLIVNNAPSAGGDELQAWLAGLREDLRLRLREVFAAHLEQGLLTAAVDPQAAAQFVATLAGGIAVEAQSGTGREALNMVVDHAMRGFTASLTGR